MVPNFDLPWVIFSIGTQLYAISTRLVTGIMQIPPVVRVAEAPDLFLGVCNVRGDVIPIVNMRKLLGMASADKEAEENVKLLAEKRDNLDRWLKELIRCAEKGLRFSLSPDPSKYRNFAAFGVGVSMSAELKKLDPYYSELHGYAQRIIAMNASDEGYDEAVNDILQQMEKSVQKAFRILDELAQQIREKLTPMIITLSFPSTRDTCMGFSVDSVKAVDEVELLDKKENSRMLFMSGHLCGVAHSERFPGEILLMDDTEIVKLIQIFKDSVDKKEQEEKKKKEEKEKEKNKDKEDTGDKKDEDNKESKKE